MAEFVEKQLEQLLPVFENIAAIELLPETELSELIGECRRYEYQLAKRAKNPRDFIVYADFLINFISRIERRRKEMQQKSRYGDIEKPLKYKCAFLYRLCSERFKKEEYFRKEIEYAKSANLLGVCSQAYTRFLQFHGHDVRIHKEAGMFEFLVNESVKKAMVIFLMALRKFPNDSELYTSLQLLSAQVISTVNENANKNKPDMVTVQDTPKSIATENEDIISITSTELASILTKVLHDNVGVLVQAAIKKL